MLPDPLWQFRSHVGVPAAIAASGSRRAPRLRCAERSAPRGHDRVGQGPGDRLSVVARVVVDHHDPARVVGAKRAQAGRHRWCGRCCGSAPPRRRGLGARPAPRPRLEAHRLQSHIKGYHPAMPLSGEVDASGEPSVAPTATELPSLPLLVVHRSAPVDAERDSCACPDRAPASLRRRCWPRSGSLGPLPSSRLDRARVAPRASTG